MFFISKFTLPFFCSFNESDNKCELAYLDYLEDPASGQTPKLFYIDYDDVLNLHMYCRGGEHCCHRNHLNQCDVNEGDCNDDMDCKGSLICGNNMRLL